MTKIETLIGNLEFVRGYFQPPNMPEPQNQIGMICVMHIDETIAALRQADQQAQPNRYRMLLNARGGLEAIYKLYQDERVNVEIFVRDPDYRETVTEVLLTEITSPPAQPQVRELTEEEITRCWCELKPEYSHDKIITQFARAVIAADRAIRPAAGMVIGKIFIGADGHSEQEYFQTIKDLPSGIYDVIAASQKETGK